MITVTIAEDGRFVDEIQFDGANVIAYEGALTVIHRDVMPERAGGGLWHLVAHAAAIVAATFWTHCRARSRRGRISTPLYPFSRRRQTFRRSRACVRSPASSAAASSRTKAGVTANRSSASHSSAGATGRRRFSPDQAGSKSTFASRVCIPRRSGSECCMATVRVDGPERPTGYGSGQGDSDWIDNDLRWARCTWPTLGSQSLAHGLPILVTRRNAPVEIALDPDGKPPCAPTGA